MVVFISVSGAALLLINSNYFETGVLDEQTTEYKYIGDNVTNQIDVANELIFELTINNQMKDILSTNHDSEDSVMDLYDSILFRQLIQSSLQQELFDNLLIYTTNPTVGEIESFRFLSSSVQEEEWYERISTSRRPSTIIEIDGGIYVLYRMEIEDDSNDYMNIAITKIDITILDNITYDNYTVMITNHALESVGIIYDDKDLDKADDMYAQIAESTYLEDEMIIQYDIIPGTTLSKWNLIIVTERINFLTEFLQYTGILFAVISLIVFGIFYRFNFIRQVNESFNQLSPEDIESIIASSNPSKIERIIKNLYQTVETLVEQNQELKFINQEKEMQKNEAEKRALLSQINPHYIFNLLNSIHKRALQNNELGSAKMILLMSKQLRHSLEWREAFVTIKEELDHIKSYITLQQHYFGTECDFNYDLDETLYDIKVPKLIFQTLIENALKHGVKNSPFYVQLKQKDDFLSFSVTNDVKGKPKEAIQRISNLLEQKEDYKEREGIGLHNMKNRLEYYYNSSYKIITQAYKSNISITIILPKEY
jgi:two-component system sensor histidine kinase YesM